MERINDREAVAKLARAVLGKGERTTNEEAVLELLFVMSREDEAGERAKRGHRPVKKIARSA
jgi:hypothetical protein